MTTHNFSLFDPTTYAIAKITLLILALLVFLVIYAAPAV